MKIIKDENGNDIEVMTTEEVTEKLKEAEDEKIKEVADATAKVTAEYEEKLKPFQSQIDTIKKEKEDLESKLNGAGPQAANFKELKDALDKKTTDLDNLTKKVSDLETSKFSEQRSALIEKFSKGDAELSKKIDLHMKESLSGMSEQDVESLAKKVESAAKLANDSVHFNPLDYAGGGGGRGFDVDAGGKKVEFSQREVALGNKLGISNDDYKKYGPMVPKK